MEGRTLMIYSMGVLQFERRKSDEKDSYFVGGSTSCSIDDPGGIRRTARARVAFLQHGRFVVGTGYGARQCVRSPAWAKGDVPRS